jgi:hypothetical protein
MTTLISFARTTRFALGRDVRDSLPSYNVAPCFAAVIPAKAGTQTGRLQTISALTCAERPAPSPAARGVGGVSDRMRSAAETASACLRECAPQERVGVRAVDRSGHNAPRTAAVTKFLIVARDNDVSFLGSSRGARVNLLFHRPHPNPLPLCGRGSLT